MDDWKKPVSKTAQYRGQKPFTISRKDYFTDLKKSDPASLKGLPEGADCVGTADGTVEAGLLWLASLVDGVLVVVGWVGVPVVGLLRVIPAIWPVGGVLPRPIWGAPGGKGPGLGVCLPGWTGGAPTPEMELNLKLN